jgi:hypothetical protein
MTVDENTDTGDPAQSMILCINPTTSDPVNAGVRGRIGKHHKPKSPTSIGHPPLRVTYSIPMEINNGPHCHQRTADVTVTQKTTGTVTFASSRQEQDLSEQLKHLPASKNAITSARPQASSESFLSSSSNTSRHDRVIVDAIVTPTFQGDLCTWPQPPLRVVIKHPRTLSIALALGLPSELGRSRQTSPLPLLFGCTFPLKHDILSNYSSTHNFETIQFQEMFGTYLAPW